MLHVCLQQERDKKLFELGDVFAYAAVCFGSCVLVKRKWDHRDITSNGIANKHLHR